MFRVTPRAEIHVVGSSRASASAVSAVLSLAAQRPCPAHLWSDAWDRDTGSPILALVRGGEPESDEPSWLRQHATVRYALEPGQGRRRGDAATRIAAGLTDDWSLEALWAALQLNAPEEGASTTVGEVPNHPFALLLATGFVKFDGVVAFTCHQGRYHLGLAGGKLNGLVVSGDGVPRLFEDSTITSDPTLAPLFAMHQHGATDVQEELAFQAHYAPQLAGSDAWRNRCTALLKDLCTIEVLRQVTFTYRASDRRSTGVPLPGLVFDVAQRCSEDQLARHLGGLSVTMHVDRTGPALDETLPRRDFGRLFFLLNDGVPLSEAIAGSRLAPKRALAALVVAKHAGLVGQAQAPDTPTPLESVAPRATTDSVDRSPTPRKTAPVAVIPAVLQAAEEARRNTPRPGSDRTRTISKTAALFASTATPHTPRRKRRASIFPVFTELEPSHEMLEDVPALPRYAPCDTYRAGLCSGCTKHMAQPIAGTRFRPHVEQFGSVLVYYRVGGGGGGEVLLGVQRGEGGFMRPVAIKRLLDDVRGDDDAETAFIEEANRVAQLHHPNIVQTYLLTMNHDDLRMTMEFVHGVSLQQLLATNAHNGTQVPVDVARYIGVQAAQGLHFVHNAEDYEGQHAALVHRDIAPQNIMIGFNGSVKLIDFGIADKAETVFRELAEGRRSGRLSYMAPEIILGRGVDHRSDQFSLGVTLYELLTGSRCFPQRNTGDRVKAIVSGQARPIIDLRPDLHPQLAYTIHRCLSPDPDMRFGDSGEVARRLSQVGEPLTADVASRMAELVNTEFESLRVAEQAAILRMLRSVRNMSATKQMATLDACPNLSCDLHDASSRS